jgi:hypothetical protein
VEGCCCTGLSAFPFVMRSPSCNIMRSIVGLHATPSVATCYTSTHSTLVLDAFAVVTRIPHSNPTFGPLLTPRLICTVQALVLGSITLQCLKSSATYPILPSNIMFGTERVLTEPDFQMSTHFITQTPFKVNYTKVWGVGVLHAHVEHIPWNVLSNVATQTGLAEPIASKHSGAHRNESQMTVKKVNSRPRHFH